MYPTFLYETNQKPIEHTGKRTVEEVRRRSGRDYGAVNFQENCRYWVTHEIQNTGIPVTKYRPSVHASSKTASIHRHRLYSLPPLVERKRKKEQKSNSKRRKKKERKKDRNERKQKENETINQLPATRTVCTWFRCSLPAKGSSSTAPNKKLKKRKKKKFRTTIGRRGERAAFVDCSRVLANPRACKQLVLFVDTTASWLS